MPSGPAPDPRRHLRLAPKSGDVVPARPRQPARSRELDEMPSDEDVERFSNVTRTCPECRKEVFDDAELCYHCGHAFENTAAGSPTQSKRWIILTAIVIIAAFVLGALWTIW